MTENTKESRINEELSRLNLKFELVDANQREVLAPMLQNAAFMKVTLEDLQEKINQEGVVEVYQNGANQHGMKQSATLQSYNSLIKNYASIMKIIAQLVPNVKKPVAVWQPKVMTPEEEAADLKRIREESDALAEMIRADRERREAEGKEDKWP